MTDEGKQISRESIIEQLKNEYLMIEKSKFETNEKALTESLQQRFIMVERNKWWVRLLTAVILVLGLLGYTVFLAMNQATSRAEEVLGEKGADKAIAKLKKAVGDAELGAKAIGVLLDESTKSVHGLATAVARLSSEIQDSPIRDIQAILQGMAGGIGPFEINADGHQLLIFQGDVFEAVGDCVLENDRKEGSFHLQALSGTVPTVSGGPGERKPLTAGVMYRISNTDKNEIGKPQTVAFNGGGMIRLWPQR